MHAATQGESSPAMTAARPAYFGNRVLRLAIKTALAQHIGTDALALLVVICMTEDARRYRGPVAFWNDQLLPLVGFGKWERLDKARNAAIEAGWLLYEAGGRHRPGLYRATIPTEFDDVTDAAVDEGSPTDRVLEPPVDTPLDIPQKGSNRGATGGTSGGTTGGTFLPTPKPLPEPAPETCAAIAAHAETTSKRRRTKAELSAPQPIELPSELNTPECRQALDDWQEHRRQLRKPLNALAVGKLLKEWSKKGAGRFVAAVDHSIANGWQGIFEPKSAQQGDANAEDDPRGNFAAGRRYLEMFGGGDHE